MMNYVIGPVGPKFSPAVSKELKDRSDVHYFKLPYILKVNFRNFAKSFVKKISTLS